MRQRSIYIALAIAVVSIASPAFAQRAVADQTVDSEQPTHDIELDPVQVAADIAANRTAWERNPVSLTLHMGVGTPLGVLGMEAEYSVTRNLAFHGGVGMASGGAQLAAGVRLRHNLSRTLSIGIGAGMSGGDYHEFSFHAPGYEWEDTIWVNAEAFIEKRFGRLALRAYVGWSNAVSHGACTDTSGDGPCGTRDLPEYPHIGLAIGWSW